MNKKTKIAAALCAAASCVSAANAETTYGGLPVAAQQDEAYLSQQGSIGFDGGFYTQANLGYSLDDDEPYYVLQLGYQFEPRDYAQFGVFFQYLRADIDDSISGVKLNEEYAAISLGISSEVLFAEKTSFYTEASFGQIDQEISGEAMGVKVSISDDSFYMDLAAGLRYRFNDSFSANLGARYFFIDDFEFEGYSTGSRDGIGLEAGLTFRF